MSALVDTGALKRVTQIVQGGDVSDAAMAAKVILAAFLASEVAQLARVVDALRAALRAFGPAGAHGFAATSLTGLLSKCLCDWSREPRGPASGLPSNDAASRRSLKRGWALGELLMADAHVLPYLCDVILFSPSDAFQADALRDLQGADAKGCEPFYAGRILHYLDGHTGPALAARLAALMPEAVLRPVREAAGREFCRSTRPGRRLLAKGLEPKPRSSAHTSAMGRPWRRPGLWQPARGGRTGSSGVPRRPTPWWGQMGSPARPRRPTPGALAPVSMLAPAGGPGE